MESASFLSRAKDFEIRACKTKGRRHRGKRSATTNTRFIRTHATQGKGRHTQAHIHIHIYTHTTHTHTHTHTSTHARTHARTHAPTHTTHTPGATPLKEAFEALRQSCAPHLAQGKDGDNGFKAQSRWRQLLHSNLRGRVRLVRTPPVSLAVCMHIMGSACHVVYPCQFCIYMLYRYVYVCMYIYVYVCMYIDEHTNIHMHTHTHTHTHTNEKGRTRTRTHTHTHNHS